ncbi:DUF3037 domain-containing protein [Sediminitomix flava]|uniref:DUF3037 family protein n=1 Tax=Sediminitomix flava TaxID=379075 RepID=A0A315Z6Z6_SEDFL|nr:DUF3037 domain-containing protein [Sediminitomix flava]PWJ39175.1 Protein of unknown function (DUF3037) [Sediminitomix flava]
MQEKQVYEYAVIRYVPRVEREEFINVGVILYCKNKKYLGLKYQIDEKRLAAFPEHCTSEQLLNYLNSWDLVCQGSVKGGHIAQLDMGGRFRWLTATRSTIIQSSKVHPGMCNEPAEILEDLFTKYIV